MNWHLIQVVCLAGGFSLFVVLLIWTLLLMCAYGERWVESMDRHIIGIISNISFLSMSVGTIIWFIRLFI